MSSTFVKNLFMQITIIDTLLLKKIYDYFSQHARLLIGSCRLFGKISFSSEIDIQLYDKTQK